MKELQLFREYQIVNEILDKVDPFEIEKVNDDIYKFTFVDNKGSEFTYQGEFKKLNPDGGFFEYSFETEEEGRARFERITNRGQLAKLLWTNVTIMDDFAKKNPKAKGIVYEAKEGQGASRATVYDRVFKEIVPKGEIGRYNTYENIGSDGDSSYGVFYNSKFTDEQDIEELKTELQLNEETNSNTTGMAR